MENIELNVNKRTSLGNGPSRALRRQGFIPAVLYGPGKEAQSLLVNNKDLERILKEGPASQLVLTLVIQNGKAIKKTVMIKELQTHPVSRTFLHVDFYEVSMDRQIRVNVPVVTIGDAKGVEEVGIVQIDRRELEVQCLPSNIPEVFEVDITDLDIGDSIHVEDIPIEEGVEILADTNFTILTIASPRREEEVEAAEEDEEAEETGEGEEEPEGDPEG